MSSELAVIACCLGVISYNFCNGNNLNVQNVQEWPSLSEGNTNQRRTNNNYRTNLGNISFPSVKTQINLWDSRSNQYSNSIKVNGTTSGSAGLKFDETSIKNDWEYTAKGTSGPSKVGDDELREFSEKLLEMDENNAAKYLTVNFQGRTNSRSTTDQAPDPLIHINMNDIQKISTISKLLPLHDNYITDSKMNEIYTPQEKQEENSFLDAILNTKIMDETRKFLQKNSAINGDKRRFKTLLKEIWFDLYPRNKGKLGSSGFEHVFLGEIKNNQVSGLHNWLYFYRSEKAGDSNYLGYLRKLDLGNSKGAILKFNFNHHNLNKPVNSMFIGTSPELEMALYTTCFILRHDKVCPLELNRHRLVIRTYTFNYDNKKMIGSAFPEI